ncbi:hypothetical protein A3F08_00645 [Candidatus Berkelbacteria bacterium RIFCSPHIGHO2_12_FULL_36_9]|uniref:Uncharacterized protein n=1 Tax=Candidatus Berkelbacteria bacterium RIFCSPHIGHO2_12_FULL_36_9 TaxID=1797469 RepID=A0A1F5EJ22_9BACT|nr:MAG: hypothetical protein A3F08_00645 [Candidatus Berkelbacteria bacterium RIFCSPHIGHO2_12_FULL_36_9]
MGGFGASTFALIVSWLVHEAEKQTGEKRGRAEKGVAGKKVPPARARNQSVLGFCWKKVRTSFNKHHHPSLKLRMASHP